MFTGIITDIGRLYAIRGNAEGGFSFDIATRLPKADLAIGASVACSGVCLTVSAEVRSGDDGWIFTVDASPETLSVTNLGDWQVGEAINLEAALRVGDALGGHWVSGHVDGVGTVRTITTVGDGHMRWFIACPAELMVYIADRGSVAVDGCSLTVTEVTSEGFAFNMIPHTRAQTSFVERSEGASVHIEVDILARYIARWNMINVKEKHD